MARDCCGRMRILHLTCAHRAVDNRILHLECASLVWAGHEVTIAGPHQVAERILGVSIAPLVGNATVPGWFRVVVAIARGLGARIGTAVHFHDPHLILLGPLLRLVGKHSIYDVHDDYEASLRDWLARYPRLAPALAKLWWAFEYVAARLSSAVVVADRHLAKKFQGCRPIILPNYPRLDFTPVADATGESTFNVIYVGGVSRARGVDQVVAAIDLLPFEDLRFHVIGDCGDLKLRQRITTHPRVVYHGRVAWDQLHQHYVKAHVGVALYQRLQGFLYCPGENAVKILEYMAAGIPVVCSDFPGLRAFVEESGYGITVAPDDAVAIAQVLRRLYEEPALRVPLGEAGRRAFEANYNWEAEEPKLLGLYAVLAAKNRRSVWSRA